MLVYVVGVLDMAGKVQDTKTGIKCCEKTDGVLGTKICFGEGKEELDNRN